MREGLTSGLLALALFAGASPAFADIRVLTFEGVVQSGSDGANQFGIGGGSLANLPYVQNFTYDTSGGVHISTFLGDQLFGGSIYGIASPILSSSITINGVTHEIGGADNGDLLFGYLGAFGGPKGIKVLSQQSQSTPTGFISAGQNAQMILNPSPAFSLTDVFSSPLTGDSDPALNGFVISVSYFAGPGGFLSFGTLKPSTVLLSLPGATGGQGPGSGPGVGAVPEPASWAMMIAGFGLTGTMMRRRRSPTLKTA